ncbi:Glycoside hydrolase, family 31 [Moelleriella libera RCEF 2490]|uniref:alpha-glucosidase n=1 Tax=Moelleriella libera RCEF 2490 TaxID=1081109 RepID=A0A168E8P0_9HYPO|nr:Glycoside hydrolase, family 31 [Moelleriella libera RCEF 2490]
MVLMEIRRNQRGGVPAVSSSAMSSTVGGEDGLKYRFAVLADGVLRYEWAPDGIFEDRPSTFAYQREQESVPYYKVKETKDSLEIVTSRFHMTYNKQVFSAHGFYAVASGFADQPWRFGEPNETLGGTYRTLDGVDGRVAVEPGVTSRTGIANIDDSKSTLFGDDGFIAPRRTPLDGRVDGYLFCYGHDYREAVKALYKISGSQPLLPRWTLGNWWSRYYEYTADSYLELVDAFGEIKVPLSVGVIDMDWHLVQDPLVDEAGVTGWTGYSWNRKLFPDPKKFIDQLHARRLKTALNEHPAEGVAFYEDKYAAVARALDFDTREKETIPFDCTDKKFLKAYFDILIAYLEDDGVDFWWIDWQQGPFSRVPGVDPLWVLNHFHFSHIQNKLQAEGAAGSSHPIIFSRYGGPGSHRYPVGFSGDTVTTWESLHFQPEFTATASNVGYGWWSHDIGGHMHGYRDDDLTSRWVQLGVFSPIMRLHSTKNQWVCKEPWKLPYHAREVVTEFLRLRHRLIPYLYAMNVRAAETGSPLIQPMYWEHPDRDEAYLVPNQYYFGTEMIVAPITTPQNAVTKTGKVRAWLPPGRFVDFFTGVVYEGGRSLWLNRTLDKTPVLLKQGAIVPLDGATELENGTRNPDHVELVLVVGADGTFELLEAGDDDGDDAEHGKGHQKGQGKSGGSWLRTTISFTQATGAVQIKPGASTKARKWKIRLLGAKARPDGVAGFTTVANATVIDVGRVPPGVTATVDVGENPQLRGNDAQALSEALVLESQMPYDTKDAIGRIMASARDVSAAARAAEVDATDMDADMRLVLKEILLADAGATTAP